MKKSQYYIRIALTWILCIIAPTAIIFIINFILAIIQYNIGMSAAFVLGALPQWLIFGAFISLAIFITNKTKNKYHNTLKQKYLITPITKTNEGDWFCPICGTFNIKDDCQKCKFVPIFGQTEQPKLNILPNSNWVCPKCGRENGNFDICTSCWTDRREYKQ